MSPDGAGPGGPSGAWAGTAPGWEVAPPGFGGPQPRPPAPIGWRDALAGLVVLLGVAALGAPLALLWSAIGPHVLVLMTPNGAILDDYNTEAFVGGDVTFGAIAIGAGIITGALAWALRRWRGPALLVGVALGGIAGAWVTWKLGHRIGLSEYRDLVENAAPGRRFEQPMQLRAHGLIFLQATVAVIVYVVNAAWSHRPDLGAAPHSPPPAFPGASLEWAVPQPAQEVSSGPSVPAAPPAAPAPPATGTASSPPA